MFNKQNDLIEIPRDLEFKNDHSISYLNKRIEFITKQTGVKLRHINNYSVIPEDTSGNIENLIGFAQIPIGITGPLKINGSHAKGEFYIPLATTEGVLITSYHRGMRLLTRAGGVNTCIFKDELHISPIFIIYGVNKMKLFIEWIHDNLNKIKEEAEKTTKHGKLLNIKPSMTGEGVVLKFSYSTGDAMGMNMINKATDEACKFISKLTQAKYYIRSNFSSDKKISANNIIKGYGKEIFAEATIPKKLFVERKIRTTPEEIYSYRTAVMSSSVYAGMIGMNAQFANFLAAIFIACGQDVAHVVNSSVGISSCKVLPSGDLYISVYLPNLLVGTIGGGTALPTQRECLEILGCYGNGMVLKFAEIVAAGVLAGELAISIAITNGSFVEAHERLGRNRPK